MRNIFLAIPDLFFRLEKDGTIIECHGKLDEDFILSPSVLIGKKIQDIPVKEISGKFQNAIDELNSAKSIVSIEYPLTIDSVKEYYETRLIPLDDNQFIAIIRNISERKRTEEALKESEERYRTFINSVPNFVFLKDENLKYIEVNSALVQFLAKESRDEIIGKVNQEIMPPEMASQCSSGDELVMNTLQVHVTEVSFNGIYLSVIKFPVRLSDNRVGIGGFISDITQRKNAENEIARQRYLIDQLLENVPDRIYFKDTNSRFLAVSKSFLNYLNFYSMDEIIGKTDFDIFDNEHAQDAFNDEQEIIKTGKPIIGKEEKEILFGNMERWVLTTKMPWRDAGGEIKGTFGISRDITSKKHAEEELIRQNYLIDQLMETSPDLIYFKDKAGRFISISKSFFSRFGINSREELIGKTDFDLFKEEQARAFFKEDQRIIYTGVPIIDKEEKEFWLNNETHWNITSKMPWRDSNGEIMGTFGISRDITEKRETEIGLQNAMNFIAYIINVLPIAIISIDNDMEVTLFNKTAAEFSSDPQSIEKNNRLFTKFPELKFINDLLHESKASQKQISGKKSIADREGNVKHYEIEIVPIKTITFEGRLITIENVTKKKMMDHVMIQSEKILSVAGLAAGMAHEINNPLGTIVQGCQNIFRRVSTQLPKNLEIANKIGINVSHLDEYFRQRQIYEILDSIHNAADKAAGIIKNMLQFSRRSESKKALYSLPRLIDETLDLAYNDYDLKKRFDFRRIKFTKILEPDLPEIRLTATEIQQVVFNLLQNAAHAIKSENHPGKVPEIIIRLYREQIYCCMEIEDNGPGIEDKIKNRIFEPFFTTKDVGEGTGLGLSVSYMIITTNHSGLISVDSVLGRGTKFLIKLPID